MFHLQWSGGTALAFMVSVCGDRCI